MHTGSVRFFDPRGFGFVICDNPTETGHEELYFHCNSLPGKRGARFIEDGARVSFELGTYKTPNNIVAKKIQLLDGTLSASNGGPSNGQN